LEAPAGADDPRFQVNLVLQNGDGGIDFASDGGSHDEEADE